LEEREDEKRESGTEIETLKLGEWRNRKTDNQRERENKRENWGNGGCNEKGVWRTGFQPWLGRMGRDAAGVASGAEQTANRPPGQKDRTACLEYRNY